MKGCSCLKASCLLFLVNVCIGLVGWSLVSDCGCLVVEYEFGLGSFGGSVFSFPFLLDWVSVSVCCAVLLVSCCVMMFSSFYMSHEENMSRFIWLVMLFVFSMILLIFVPSLLGMMVGWDGLGIVSFVLVMYYKDKISLGSAMITFLSNRIGDGLLIVGIGLFSFVGSWHFCDLGVYVVSSVFVGLVVLGSMTKSAQLPFSAWLPAAMTAPTPVSALVHSSTLVTAGVYVVFRFSSSMSFEWCFFLLFVSSLTMMMAGLSACLEYDLKKVIAFSTLSQLGVMMFSLAIGSPFIGIMHLVIHALFKSMMFLCGGYFIFVSGGVQDSRFIGGVWTKYPMVSFWLVCSCLCLMGLPFLSGFYSKDFIIELFMFGNYGVFVMLILGFSTLLTSYYGTRLIMNVFFKPSDCAGYFFPCEKRLVMLISVSILGVCSIIGGSLVQGLCSSYCGFVGLGFVYKMAVLSWLFLGVSFGVVSHIKGMVVFGLCSDLVLKESSKVWLMLNDMMSSLWYLMLVSGRPVSSKCMEAGVLVDESVESGWSNMFVMGGGGASSLMNMKVWFSGGTSSADFVDVVLVDSGKFFSFNLLGAFLSVLVFFLVVLGLIFFV
uniref:NADH-ubiquinone oxidoreductase chain 5 n=1 Tax=Solen grandis TaxID=165599 RepID=G9BY50_9BIVA|nr:NADH dehydrogenase subunit 5 [Solen grandis]ADV42023.1 NADH dehydrogenase subunit 5 [Solen grandis]